MTATWLVTLGTVAVLWLGFSVGLATEISATLNGYDLANDGDLETAAQISGGTNQTDYGAVVTELSSGNNLVTAQSATNPPTTLVSNILPLGDSLTFGSFRGSVWIPGGYRTAFHAELAAHSNFQFVGSSDTNPSQPLSAAGQTRHAGQPGFTIQQIITGVDTLLASSQPDYVLLMIGTHDVYNPVFWGGAAVGTGGADTSFMQAKLQSLVEKIVAARPAAHVLVSSLLPIGLLADSAANIRVKNFNAAIEHSIVPHFIERDHRVSFVDNYGSFVDDNGGTNSVWANSDPDWHIHPNQAGYDIIGVNFATVIRSLAVPEPDSGALILSVCALAAAGGLLSRAVFNRSSRSRVVP